MADNYMLTYGLLAAGEPLTAQISDGDASQADVPTPEADVPTPEADVPTPEATKAASAE